MDTLDTMIPSANTGEQPHNTRIERTRERTCERQTQKAQRTVERQITATLREMERHGEGLATIANGLAVLLLIVFSAASLISISLAAFNHFVAEWQAGRLDLTDGLSVALTVLLVIAMDMAMLYAASVIRALTNAGGATREMLVHIMVMVTASALEASTYIYLVVQYDHPTNGWLWAIGIGRGIAAPLFATYLSLARKLPIAPRDIAYYTSLLSGKGVVHDVAVLAGDRAAPLATKVAIYTASASMQPADRARFESIIAAVEGRPAERPEGKRKEEPAPAPAEQPEEHPVPAPVPFPQRQGGGGAGEEGDGGGQRQPNGPARTPAAPALAPAARMRNETRKASLTEEQQRAAALAAAMRRGGGGRKAERMGEPAPPTIPLTRADLRQRREEVARTLLALTPEMSVRELARQIAVATHNSISEASARALRVAVLEEMRQMEQQTEQRPAAPVKRRATPLTRPQLRPALRVMSLEEQNDQTEEVE